MTTGTYNLIVEKDEFIKQINLRVKKGNELLSFPVPYLANKRFSVAELSDFLSKYENWGIVNIDLLENSFNSPDNKYKIRYENSVSETVVPSIDVAQEDINIVRNIKVGIQKQINVLESFVEYFPTNNSILKEISKDEIKEKKQNAHNMERKDSVSITISDSKNVTIVNQSKDVKVNQSMINKIEESTKEIKDAIFQSQELSDIVKEEVLEQISEILEQAKLPEEKRNRKNILKAILNGIGATLNPIGSLAEIWSTWGAGISKFLNF